MHTVLIVEDEKLIRQGIRVMIQRSGVPVDVILECNNGLAALETLKTQKVDVMFTDIRMPKMDGIELVNAMQELPEIPYTVAISGYDDFSYAVEMLRKGVKDYLLKPVDREKITELMQRFELELSREQKNQKKDESMCLQQLKYYLCSRNISEEEEKRLADQYGHDILEGKYVVCCSCNTDMDLYKKEPFLYLSNIEGHEFYIVREDYLEILLHEELHGQYTGISMSHQGFSQLRDAVKESVRARKSAFFLCKPDITYREEMEKVRESNLKLEDTFIEQLVQMIGTEKYTEAVRKLERIFANARLGGYSPTEVESALEIFLKQAKEVYKSVIALEEEEISQLLQIYAYANLDEYRAELIGWVTQFAERLGSQFDDYKNKQKMKQAVEYIRENYNKDLNMAVVSNRISMNYSLFSYAFKQYTGKNFVNYLKEIRIEKAKQLLAETDDKIIEISQAVGYENEKHFMKTFKAVCGVSTTEYRKNMRMKQD